MHTAVALVALALGYKVFVDAHKEKDGLKLLGQIVGVAVMVAAVLCVFCGAVMCLHKSSCGKSGCMMMSKDVNYSGTDTAAKPTCPMGGMSDSSK